MKNYQITSHPDHTAESEMIRYGLNHDDPIVNWLANFADETLVELLQANKNSVEELIHDHDEAIHDLEYTVEELTEEKEDKEREVYSLTIEKDALRYQLDRDMQNDEVKMMRARLMQQQDDYRVVTGKLDALRRDNAKLQDKFEHLQSKFDTWTIIAT